MNRLVIDESGGVGKRVGSWVQVKLSCRQEARTPKGLIQVGEDEALSSLLVKEREVQK